MSDSARPFERVYTMPDYYDGPRGGIADFDGRPHAYSSVFDYERDDYADTFDLRPADHETLELALEDCAISARYWDAVRAGEETGEPRVLPADRARHAELVPLLRARLAALPDPVARARAVFRRGPGWRDSTPGYGHEVQWTPVVLNAK